MFVAYRGRISREWRQKIESWLQANEADEKQNDDFKKKRKLLSANRRSYETDNESDRGGSKLDPLPEEKPPAMTSPEQQPASGLATTSYKRVYQDWKPSSALEKTDVVGTMEAIAGRRSLWDHQFESSHSNFALFQMPSRPPRTSPRGASLVSTARKIWTRVVTEGSDRGKTPCPARTCSRSWRRTNASP